MKRDYDTGGAGWILTPDDTREHLQYALNEEDASASSSKLKAKFNRKKDPDSGWGGKIIIGDGKTIGFDGFTSQKKARAFIRSLGIGK